LACRNCHRKEWYESDIHQRPGGDAPECCTGTRRRIDVGDSAERPEYDPISSSSDLTTSQGMTKFMGKNNQEQSEILQDIPNDRRVSAGPALDLVDGYKKPRPMQEDIDSRESKQAD
jgi:hypothetical protein